MWSLNKRTKGDRVAGMCGIPAEVVKACGDCMMQLLHAIMIQVLASLTGEED